MVRRRLAITLAGGLGAFGLILIPSPGEAHHKPNHNPPGHQKADKDGKGDPPGQRGHNCPNPAGKRPPGQCKKASQ